MEGPQAFVLIKPRDSSHEPNSTYSTPSKDYKYWSSDNTRILIDCYTKHKEKVGNEIRSMRKLWEIIASEMKEITNENITTSNCENRWKVLERNYKAYVSNKKTGRGWKVFEFSKEMDQIFAKKIVVNVNPELLLEESETIDTNNTDVSYQIENVKSPQNIDNERNETAKKISRKFTFKRKNSILEKIREEQKRYYQKKLNIESAKLQEMKRRNDLLEERNNILKKFIDSKRLQ